MVTEQVVLDAEYIKGMKDARDGKPAASTNKNYERGYGAQYQLDQITQGAAHESIH
jgi:hypothetical protein